MDAGAIMIGLALLVLCIPWVARPFLRERQWALAGARKSANPEQGRNLKEQRQNILSALRDLDFDFQTGKVVEEDHRALRAQLLAEAASLAPDQEDEDDEIEALLRARREALKKTTKCSQCGERLSEADRFCPQCGASRDDDAGKVGGHAVDPFCPACGSKTVPGALYCSRCGTRLVSQEAIARQDEDDP